jgi:hypothetical protein
VKQTLQQPLPQLRLQCSKSSTITTPQQASTILPSCATWQLQRQLQLIAGYDATADATNPASKLVALYKQHAWAEMQRFFNY